MSNVVSVKNVFDNESVKAKFSEILGKKSTAFMTSVLQIVSQNDMLKSADPMSVYNVAMISATLDLPLNPNLGFAYIVPFMQKGAKLAQFQIGWKGFVQLAQRSGLYKTISATQIYEGQIKSNNPLKGIEFDFDAKKSDKVIGYCSYFELLNGFEKYFYMSVEEMEAHAKKFSQTYKKGFGVWSDNFDAMALKTVIKLNLQKFGPLSVEMQTAIQADQSVVKNVENAEFEYIDNDKEIKVEQILEIEVGDENFERCVKAILSGSQNLEQLKNKYHISEAVEVELINKVNQSLDGGN